jgi:hypothetical protein
MSTKELGSKTAKDGFRNEDYVVSEFNNWAESLYAQAWLKKMHYSLETIEAVRAEKIAGHKADVQVTVIFHLQGKSVVEKQNLQVKLVSNPKGFNQIDKRWLKKYQELWDIPQDVLELLQRFTGEIPPNIKTPLDGRRMFANEFSESDQAKILIFFETKRTLIVSDLLQGRGEFSAGWMLVILNLANQAGVQWALEPIENVMSHFGQGEIKVTDRGSVKIGNITVQRKGGDAGRDTANMLQFKINPAELITD